MNNAPENMEASRPQNTASNSILKYIRFFMNSKLMDTGKTSCSCIDAWGKWRRLKLTKTILKETQHSYCTVPHRRQDWETLKILVYLSLSKDFKPTLLCAFLPTLSTSGCTNHSCPILYYSLQYYLNTMQRLSTTSVQEPESQEMKLTLN